MLSKSGPRGAWPAPLRLLDHMRPQIAPRFCKPDSVSFSEGHGSSKCHGWRREQMPMSDVASALTLERRGSPRKLWVVRKRMLGSLEEVWFRPEDAALLIDTETRKS